MAAVDFPRQDFDEFCQAHGLEDNERLWEELNTITGSGALSVLMERANNLLDGHGVEYISHGELAAAYVNFGDPYDVTLVLDDTATPTFRLTSWGGLVETWEREHLEDDTDVAWATWGQDQLASLILRLEPDLQEELDEARDVGDEIDRIRLALEAARLHPQYGDDAAITFRQLLDGLEEINRRDPDAMYVMFGLASMARGHDVGVEPIHPAEAALDVLVSEILAGSHNHAMPAWYYMLMVFYPKAARYLGAVPSADKFAQVWMEQPLLDPELPGIQMEDPNYLDYAVALDKALRPVQVDSSVFVAAPADLDARYMILGDMIEEQNWEGALKFLKTRPLPRERRHGLEGR